MKNKYDSMRKEYNLWKSLKNGETGLGWNESTKQLNCSDEWWKRKIQENPKVLAIQNNQPSIQLQEEWDQLFGEM
ncbi:putative Myb/SANT-like domain-containing protein [Helianthus annuus]|uniref:Myb/SANT-like domain-containing protein n=2 Tax=Helianthus annuus TaxID=4232 RepID=A0A251TU45_HELAN|nr:putative Myb/SANT-like domain-containing protein [Helianthus annuus]KAJ0891875.1 putative Myb/SANT-like domain-containing protein [Helianthus annuus]